jgi:hypothetical protein
MPVYEKTYTTEFIIGKKLLYEDGPHEEKIKVLNTPFTILSFMIEEREKKKKETTSSS